MVNWCRLPIGGRVSALPMSGVRHRVAGSLRREAATAGDVAAAPPASSKAPAVAGDSPARGALVEVSGLGFAKPKRVQFH